MAILILLYYFSHFTLSTNYVYSWIETGGLTKPLYCILSIIWFGIVLCFFSNNLMPKCIYNYIYVYVDFQNLITNKGFLSRVQ